MKEVQKLIPNAFFGILVEVWSSSSTSCVSCHVISFDTFYMVLSLYFPILFS